MAEEAALYARLAREAAGLEPIEWHSLVQPPIQKKQREETHARPGPFLHRQR